MDRRFLIVCSTVILSACMQRSNMPAPVVALSNNAPAPMKLAAAAPTPAGVEKARVRPGDNLALIAKRYGTTVESLIKNNNLRDPNKLKPGQMLSLHEDPEVDFAKRRPLPPLPTKQPAASTPKVVASTQWDWPTKGPVLQGFSPEGNRKKGIEIGGSRGQPIVAAQDGVVVYKGTGIRGYGQLVILKHQDHYLTAYGHTDTVLVEEGAKVKKGDKIALMGADDEKAKLHFEVRHYGKPLDPMRFLAKS